VISATVEQHRGYRNRKEGYATQVRASEKVTSESEMYRLETRTPGDCGE
jgi:hypothetical protein